MWYVHTMKYYSVMEINEIPIHATTQMNLENLRLSEVSLTQKNKYYRFHLQEVPRIDKFIVTESRVIVTRGEEEMGNQWSMGTEPQFGVMQMFWKWIVEMVAQNFELLNATELYI